jgi:apolipoprotein N-acyltransferase
VPLRLLAAAVAGLALSLAYEPVALAYLMPFSLAVYALVTRGLRARGGFAVGLVFGIAFYYVHIWWMSSSIGTDAWAALAGIEAFFYGLLGAAATVLHRLRAWPAWLALGWVAMEVVRSGWPFSGMPWGRLGFGVVDTPYAPALAYVGVNGVSLLVAGTGFLLARLVLAAGEQRLFAAAGLVGVVAVSTVPAIVPWTLPVTGETTVAAVQGDVPGAGNDVLYDPDGVTENHVVATERLVAEVAAGRAPAPDFVLWPENSTARDPFRSEVVHDGIERAVAAAGVPVVVGAIVDDGPDHILNQGIVWDPVTGAGERYTKWHPVPYGEYIPFRKYLSGLFGRLDRIPRDMKSGSRTEPLRVAGVDVADAICFDIAYDDGLTAQLTEGADLMTVQTSNASFIFTDQIEQQFAITRARALESGKYVVVAAINGITGVIAPDGSVVDRTQRLTQDVVVETVELRSGVTPGVRVGRALATIAPVATLLGVLLGLLVGRRDRRRAAADRSDDGTTTTREEPACVS